MAVASVVSTGQAFYGCLTSQSIQYLFYYDHNITKLRQEIQNLEANESTIKQRVDEAKRNAETIRHDVSRWLERVETIKKEANQVLEGELVGCLFSLWPRYFLSKQAFEKASEIFELRNETSTFGTVGVLALESRMLYASPQEFDGFKSRERNENEIMEALESDSITVIGICGMAGVRKTTLVKQIADKVKARNSFDEVAMAVVSKDVSIANIQNQLAENLELKIEEKTDTGRARRLYTRLMNKDKRILIILDDLWQDLDFHVIGIPEGLKIMLTSRRRDVCEKMNARTFEVEVLSKEESWYLFQEAARISEKANDIKDIAEEVAEECGGLPLAIVVVGKALRNKNICTWRDAHRLLKAASVSIQDMQDLVYSRIKLSY